MKPTVSPTVSIIIVNWNTRDLLSKCLESVRSASAAISHEVIVVDNASADGSADMVAERFPEVTLIRSDSNLGFSAGNNLGIERASGRYLMLLNPDAEVSPEAIEVLVEYADEHPNVAVIGPMLLNSDGSLQKNGRTFTSVWREVLGLTKLYHPWARIYPRADWGRLDFDIPAEVDEVSGACMFVRQEAVRQVGRLDERFFMYYEEVDWCRRMKKAGWEVRYLPEARVVHHWSQGAKKTGLATSRIAYRSQYRYFLKHHGPVQAAVLRTISWGVLGMLSAKYGIIRLLRGGR